VQKLKDFLKANKFEFKYKLIENWSDINYLMFIQQHKNNYKEIVKAMNEHFEWLSDPTYFKF
jgi:hypothetical protein